MGCQPTASGRTGHGLAGRTVRRSESRRGDGDLRCSFVHISTPTLPGTVWPDIQNFRISTTYKVDQHLASAMVSIIVRSIRIWATSQIPSWLCPTLLTSLLPTCRLKQPGGLTRTVRRPADPPKTFGLGAQKAEILARSLTGGGSFATPTNTVTCTQDQPTRCSPAEAFSGRPRHLGSQEQ